MNSRQKTRERDDDYTSVIRLLAGLNINVQPVPFGGVAVIRALWEPGSEIASPPMEPILYSPEKATVSWLYYIMGGCLLKRIHFHADWLKLSSLSQTCPDMQ